MLALYRAGIFIHELTHIKQGAVRGLPAGLEPVVGVPLLVPSFMYEGVHNQHHGKTYYGTIDDPEYLPLALMKPWTLPVFLIVAALAPIGLFIRFAVLAPLSLLSTEAAAHWWSSVIRGCRSTRSSAARCPRASSRATGAGWRSLARPVGDRAAGAGRDRDRAAARLPDLPRRRRRG